jgi:hypothetical protein
MIDTALTYLVEVDTFTAIEYLDQQDDPLTVANVYSTLVMRLYWEDKNLPAVVAIARAGIQYGLTAAAMASDHDLAMEIKSVAKEVAYNLASFTWPGWDEPGMIISQSDVAIGLDAAKTNLRLADELKKGDLPLSRAYWMLGRHYLASGHLDKAKACFAKAENFAIAASAEADRLLAQGFHR